ncbi:hypothetical protein BKG91_03785 [Rodentibacter caecimuris]|uniref:Uncharacterized protein n=1 Tax=Rodentibacter caecimuris TaxID=1796644 RepID=A0AAJ3K481_9PAST|nr:hypothetical protein [Rodentibacter heylii]OOF70582.1 hypothetical protein BKG90_09845 [Rodentibacter heylii]OOF75247.1 hypothetical protein BKG91_03785 [Rodentibacter heylii]OOF77197.1 hypothetical protein BKG99_04025 [Rodentibacter heylii]
MFIELPNIDEEIYPIGGFNKPEDFFQFFIFEKNSALLDEPLWNSAKRKEWVNNSPDLQQFPFTTQYIKEEKSVELSDVAQELSTVNFILPVEQVLFHQGDLPPSIPLNKEAIGKEFKLLEIFSTTLDPYIANVHEDSDVHWCIRIKGDNIRCYPIPEQDCNEYEVIILGSPKARIVDIVQKERNPYYVGVEYRGCFKTLVFLELY